MRVAVVRGIGFFAFWTVLMGPGHFVMGAVTAGLATWVSLRSLPAGAIQLRPVAAIALVARFLRQSVAAGWDVARRAFDPRLPLRPGFVTYAVGFPPGPARNVFATLTSLVPGTVPLGDEGEGFVYHCLDVEQPVVEQLAAEEAALSRALRRSDAR